MANVREWIGRLLEGVVVVYNPPDWPDGDSEEWPVWERAWVTALALAEVSEGEAMVAAERIALNPPRFRGDWIKAVADEARAVRAETAPPAGPAVEREAIQRESRGCPHCGGMGLAVVYHRWPGSEPKTPPSVAAHCSCHYGRWTRRTVAAKNPDDLRRIPDLVSVLEGRTGWTVDPPGLAEPPAGFDPKAALKELVQRHKAENALRRREPDRVLPLDRDESAFTRRLTEAEAVKFIEHHRRGRRTVMEGLASPDPILRAEALRLIGRDPSGVPNTPG